MTSFKNFFSALMGEKFRNVNFILLINIVAIVISVIWAMINGNFTNATFFQYTMTWSFLAMLVGFIRLTVLHEKIYTRDSFRLIPVGDIKFYLTNLLTSFVGIFYMCAIELVLSAATAAINWQQYVDEFKLMAQMYGSQNLDIGRLVWTFVAMIIIMLAVTVLAWTTISLIHLLGRAGGSFLPSSQSRILNFVVYIVVIFIVLRVVGFIMDMVQNSTNMLTNTNDIWNFSLFVIGILVVAAIEAAVNIYLMSHWVETVSES